MGPDLLELTAEWVKQTSNLTKYMYKTMPQGVEESMDVCSFFQDLLLRSFLAQKILQVLASWPLSSMF